MNFLDVGAHIGEYVLLAASAVGRDGSVHAFELDPRNYRILEHNVRVNNLTSVHLNQCTVYSSDGIMQLEMFNEPSITRLVADIGTSYKRQLTDQVKVRTITLDT